MKKYTLFLAVLLALAPAAQAQKQVVEGVAKAALTKNGSAAARAISETALKNSTSKATSHALINGKISPKQISPLAGSYTTRAVIEYDSGQGGILSAMDQTRLELGIQNWEKPALPELSKVLAPVTISEKELLNAVEESVEQADREVGGTPLYEVSFPSPELREFYKKAQEEISRDISSRDVANASFNISQEVVDQYTALVGEMQELNYKMSRDVLRRLHGVTNAGEARDVSLKISELTARMNAMQDRLYTPASAITQTKRNIELYQHVVEGKPMVEIEWEQKLPYDRYAFSLQQSIRSSGILPREFEFAETVNISKRKALLAKVHAQMPENLRIAVLNDEDAVPAVFREAQRDGLFPQSYKIEVYQNAGDFLSAHAAEPYDMVITDWIFPGGGGDMVLQKLRGVGDETPILFNSSGDVGAAYEQKLYEQGYSAYLPVNENFEPSTLIFSLRDYFVHAQNGKLMPLVNKK